MVLMSVSFPALLARPAAPALIPVNLADLSAKQLDELLITPPAYLLVDCSGLLLPHPLGVCRFVTQLLQISQQGTRLWLCNVHAGLFRCLQHLEMEVVFHLNE